MCNKQSQPRCYVTSKILPDSGEIQLDGDLLGVVNCDGGFMLGNNSGRCILGVKRVFRFM